MKIAFYKATRSGLQGLYSRGVRLIDGGPYSHCELIFSNGISASASFIDGGVRFKQIDYNNNHWDIFSIPDPDGIQELRANDWFVEHEGDKYDILGNVRFVFGFVKHDNNKQFCSEACAEALGFYEGWRYGPNGLASIIKRLYPKVL